MKNILILAGIAAVASATPALAKPDHGNGRGHGHSNMRGDDRDRDEQGDRHQSRWDRQSEWGNHCPPGLARKNNGCLPPGQARKRYNIGQRWSNNYGQNWSYNQIPSNWREQYNLNSNDRYYYRDGYLYQVDPRTNLVSQVLSALGR